MIQSLDHHLFFSLPSNHPTKILLLPLCEIRKNPADVIWRRNEFLFLNRADLRELLEIGGMTSNKVRTLIFLLLLSTKSLINIFFCYRLYPACDLSLRKSMRKTLSTIK